MKKARKKSKRSGGNFIQRAERLVVHYTNRERRRHGLKPLRFNKNLYRAAKFWSRVQAKNRKIMHGNVRSRLKKFGYTGYVGENVAVVSKRGSPEDVARAIVNVWMKSPGHRSNILDSNYSEIGVGLWVRGDMVYATQDFGHRTSDLVSFGYFLARTFGPWVLLLLLFGLAGFILRLAGMSI